MPSSTHIRPPLSQQQAIQRNSRHAVNTKGMSDYFANAKLFDDDILIEPDSEHSNSATPVPSSADEEYLLTSQSSTPNKNLGDIELNFKHLAVDNWPEQVEATGTSVGLQSTPISNNETAKVLKNLKNRLVVKRKVLSPTAQPSTSSTTVTAPTNSAPTNNKRQRDPDNSLQSPATVQLPKRPKKIAMAPLESGTTPRPDFYLVLLVPDLEDVNLFTAKHGIKLNASIMKAIKAEPNPEVKFEFTGFERGRYKFVCPNVAAKTWALNVVPLLTNLWDNAKIKALDQGIIPRMIKASITFNDKPPNMLDLFEGIENKNETVNTLHWRVYNRVSVTQGKKTVIFIGVDEASVKPLKDLGYRPYFEGGRIKITIQENNNDN